MQDAAAAVGMEPPLADDKITQKGMDKEDEGGSLKAPSAMAIHHTTVALCYFVAFWSLNAQWDALLGSDG